MIFIVLKTFKENAKSCSEYSKCKGDPKFCEKNRPGSKQLKEFCVPPAQQCDQEFKALCAAQTNWGLCMEYERCIGQLFCKYNKPGSDALKTACDPNRCSDLKAVWCSNQLDRVACERFTECAGISEDWCSQTPDSIRKFCGCIPY